RLAALLRIVVLRLVLFEQVERLVLKVVVVAHVLDVAVIAVGIAALVQRDERRDLVLVGGVGRRREDGLAGLDILDERVDLAVVALLGVPVDLVARVLVEGVEVHRLQLGGGVQDGGRALAEDDGAGLELGVHLRGRLFRHVLAVFFFAVFFVALFFLAVFLV